MEIGEIMFQVQGMVDNAFSKMKTSKAGKNFTINYIEVGGTTISTGFKAEHSQGEMVNIAVEQKFGEWQKIANRTGDGLPPMGAGNVAQTPTPVKGNFGNKGRFPVEATDGQMSIIRQSSMNRAVEIMDQLIKAKLVAPKTRDEYMHELMEVALMVTDFGSGQDIMQLKAAMAANQVVNQ